MHQNKLQHQNMSHQTDLRGHAFDGRNKKCAMVLSPQLHVTYPIDQAKQLSSYAISRAPWLLTLAQVTDMSYRNNSAVVT